MNIRIWSERRYLEMGYRQAILILIMGMLLVVLGTPYVGLLTGWSAGVNLENVSQPSMLVKASGAWFLVDGHGTVRGAVSDDHIPMLPQLHGIDSGALLRQEFLAVDAVDDGNALARLLLDSDDRQRYERDLQLDFSNPRNIIAAVDGAMINFGSDGFREKWDRVTYVRGARSITLPAGQEWDLRFPNTVIMREPQ